jgi:hypothetical protein
VIPLRHSMVFSLPPGGNRTRCKPSALDHVFARSALTDPCTMSDRCNETSGRKRTRMTSERYLGWSAQEVRSSGSGAVTANFCARPAAGITAKSSRMAATDIGASPHVFWHTWASGVGRANKSACCKKCGSRRRFCTLLVSLPSWLEWQQLRQRITRFSNRVTIMSKLSRPRRMTLIA